MKPLQSWDDCDKVIHPSHVWGSQLDDRYLIEVQRKDTDSATLCIFDHQNGDALIHSEGTGLSYGAAYGPDVADVATWMDRCAELVDSWK